jgi:hypothetical protein
LSLVYQKASRPMRGADFWFNTGSIFGLFWVNLQS